VSLAGVLFFPLDIRLENAVVSGLGSWLGRKFALRGKTAAKKFAYRRCSARHALFETPVLKRRQFFGSQHDLKAFLAFNFSQRIPLSGMSKWCYLHKVRNRRNERQV
jgi:hypothetical protein